MKIKGFPPIADEYCKIIILGSMPGEQSLLQNEYYANPTNQFWFIISKVVGKPIPSLYSEKEKLLLEHHIAVWDVLKFCDRKGSLDSSISNEVVNDFKAFYKEHGGIKAVFFNGGKAEKDYRENVHLFSQPKLITLPSTSAANTHMSKAEKAEKWKKEIGKFL